MAILPIFSGVTPSTLKSFLKLDNKFPSFEPISIIKSFLLKLNFDLILLWSSAKFFLKIFVVLLVYGYSNGKSIF